MEYNETKPCKELEPYIHSFWELKGGEYDGQWERNFPDGCSGLVLNVGEPCLTDNGSVSMAFGKTYAAGAMTTFKDSFIDNNTHLLGVCLKPAAFSHFYAYAPQHELTNSTVELDKAHSFSMDRLLKAPLTYLNRFYIDRIGNKNNQLESVVEDIHASNGQLHIHELAKRNGTTVRQLERHFNIHIGLTPKEYSRIIRFQKALSLIRHSDPNRSFSDIAFECGFYDHSHLTNEIKRNTGLIPSQLSLSHFSKAEPNVSS